MEELNERLCDSRNDILWVTREELAQRTVETFELYDGPLVQRCVIIQRDEKGYGLTISGNNPVFVQSIKEDGAACRAGVQQGDRIIKVNGTLVTQSNHLEVVKLIKSGSYVALTLLGRQPGHSPKPSFISEEHCNISPRGSPTERITAPQPVGTEQQQQMLTSRIQTIKKMLEEELKFQERLRCEYNQSSSEKIYNEMCRATKRVKVLEDQLYGLTGNWPDSKGTAQQHQELSLGWNPSLQSQDSIELCVTSLDSPDVSVPTTGENVDEGSYITHPTESNSSPQWPNLQVDVVDNSPCNTPPGTPPPSYGAWISSGEMEEEYLGKNNQIEESSHLVGTPPVNADLNTGHPPHPQVNIISMEEEDFLFAADHPSDDHGPFMKFCTLKRHNLHMCVFLHYLINNSDPSSLLFYHLVEQYCLGSTKDMKKWAYEIHSTFLIPGAPLQLENIDENIIKKIDDVLLYNLEKEDFLKSIFDEAGRKAIETIDDQLKDFCNRRSLGFGNFGPSDQQLEDAMFDKNKEQKIIEPLFASALEKAVDDSDNASDKNLALACALITILKNFGMKLPANIKDPNYLERFQTFVSKDSKSRLKITRFNKKGKEDKAHLIKGHHFIVSHYYSVTYCNNCGLIIWGPGNQGFQCQNCEMNVHKNCTKTVEENCVGIAARKKEKSRVSGLMDSFMKRRPTQTNPSAIEKARRYQEEKEIVESPVPLEESSETVDQPSRNVSRVEKLIDLYQNIMGDDCSTPATRDSAVHSAPETYDREERKPVVITRSESLKTRGNDRRSVRKKSDPNIPRSKSDVDEKSVITAIQYSVSSSTSSLSNSVESPNNSSEMVHKNSDTTSAFMHLPFEHLSREDTYDDPDLEVDADPPNWQQLVDRDIVRKLKPKEVKRQDVINELFHTEKNHVRNLKILDKVFRIPMEQQQILPQENLSLLFANLDEMIEIHGAFNNKMKAKQEENPIGVIGDIGDLVLSMFGGEAGDNFCKAAAKFCRLQSVGLETLKARQKKDQKLFQFLTDAESNTLCRRLQLKDIIPTGMQRLTKYPLLLENIAKYTQPSSAEYKQLMEAVDRCKHILDEVNQAVKESENHQRLVEFEHKIDKSPYEKSNHHSKSGLKIIDLTKHTMIHDGPLSWRINRQKCIDLHVVLLADLLVLLQKVDDRLVLKFHTNFIPGRESTKRILNPVISLEGLLAKDVATDKKAFFLITTVREGSGAQMYELVATTLAERKVWFKCITEAAEIYNKNKLLISVPTNSPSKLEEDALSTVSSVLSSEVGLNSPLFLENNQIESVISDPSPSPGVKLSTSLELGVVEPSGMTAGISPVEDLYQQTSAQSKFQKVEKLHLMEQPHLIYPDEVMSSQGVELGHAQIVLTPQEQLKRKDALIQKTLLEKQHLVANVLNIPLNDFDNIAEIAGEMQGEKEARELVLAAIYQVNKLASLLNQSLNIKDDEFSSGNLKKEFQKNGNNADLTYQKQQLPAVPCERLMEISSSLAGHLTQLLTVISERDEEREQLRAEVKLLHEQLRMREFPDSRPNSLISYSSEFDPADHESTDESLPVLFAQELKENLESVEKENEEQPPVEETNTKCEDIDITASFM